MSIKEQSTTFPSTSPNNKDNINQTTTTNSIAQSSNLTASATQIEEYIQLIESCTNEEDLQKVFISLKITSELISKISTRLSSNESQVKSLVIQNTDEIINLFKNIKQLKEELKKSKRNFDAIDSHLEILKKKYLDSSDKLIKSSISKTNVDFTIMMIEKIKDFISDVKSMKMYYEKDNNILLDSETPMKCFLNLSNFLNKELKEMKPYSNSNNNNSSSKEDKTLYFMKVNNESVNLNNISIIKDDLEWFNNNKLKILNLFRAKFYDAIKIQDNKQIIKYFEFFNEQKMLLEEVKSFTNKVLKDLFIENLFKNIITNKINIIDQINLVGENVYQIRREIKEFFMNLSKWTDILNNLGITLKNALSKKDLVLYEELMEADGLKGIFTLFTDKVQSSFNQIITKIKNNEKFGNALNYFTKDFLFFHVIVKNYSLRSKVPVELVDLKEGFIDKFKISCGENISRAYSLITSLEKMYLDNGGSTSSSLSLTNQDPNYINKENIMSVMEHLISYIKDMSMSTKDLYEEFNEGIIKCDELLNKTLGEAFSNSLKAQYFEKLTIKAKQYLSNNNNTSNIRKPFSFYFLIFTKIYDYFIQFTNSNINYLITNEFLSYIEEQQYSFLSLYLNNFSGLFNNEAKELILIKDFSKFSLDRNSFQVLLKDSLDREIFSSNRIYDRVIYKYQVFFFIEKLVVILMSVNVNSDSEVDLESLGKIDNFLNNFECVNVSVSKSIILKEIVEYVKTLIAMKDFNSSSFKDFLEFLRNSRSSFNIAEGIILEKNNYLSFFSNDYLTNIKTTLLTIRKLIFIEEKKVLLFIKENKLSYSSFCKLLTYKIMKTLNIIISELSLVESEMSLIDICYEFIESN